MMRIQTFFSSLLDLIRSGGYVSKANIYKHLQKNRFTPRQGRAAYRLRQFPTSEL